MGKNEDVEKRQENKIWFPHFLHSHAEQNRLSCGICSTFSRGLCPVELRGLDRRKEIGIQFRQAYLNLLF
jgi:hypothetical protein